MRIEFVASTLAELEQQIRDFLGVPAVPVNGTHIVASGAVREVPAWAPSGARWVASVGAPTLVGPDGMSIAVDWSTTPPSRG